MRGAQQDIGLMREDPLALIFLLTLFAVSPLFLCAQEKSVKPGINDRYQDPKPAEFVQRFERSGRDIYDFRDKIVEICGLKEGTDVADIGAGTGLFTRMFAAKVAPSGVVRAVDITDEFIEHIKGTCKAAGITNVVATVCAADDVGLPEASADVAFLCDTYHHLEFPQKTMASIRRALRPGGRLVVIDFERVPDKSPKWILDHVRAGKETVRQEIEAAGFTFAEEQNFLRENFVMIFRRAERP